MTWMTNYGAEHQAAWTSLATVFFFHFHQCLSWQDQSPSSSGLQDKHLRSCRTQLPPCIRITRSAFSLDVSGQEEAGHGKHTQECAFWPAEPADFSETF